MGTTQSDGLDWNDIPLLLALARDGSMRKAAAKLGVNTATVSRRVAAAESRLQARLFIRSPQGYRPTDAGRAFLEAAEGVEGHMQSLLARTRSEAGAVAGPVRITSVDAVLNDWLIPALPELLKGYPDLQVRCYPDNQRLSFTRSEADLALRVARPVEDAAIVMRRVATVGMGVYGTAAHAGVPRAAWADLPWLVFDDDLADATEAAWLARAVPNARWRFRCSAMSSLLAACEAGVGVAVLPCFAAQARRLQALTPEPVLQRELWLLAHRDAANIRRFRAVADWIAARARADAGRLSGSG